MRYYSPKLARWLTRDPIQEDGGVNVYAFNNNDPINNIDPDGLAVIKYIPGTEYKLGIGGTVNAAGTEFILNRAIPDANGVPRTNIPIVNDRPNLTPWSIGDVETHVTGDSRFDVREAIKAFEAKYRARFNRETHTFHHDSLSMRKIAVEGTELYISRMQAVPRELNGSIPHVGSASEARQLMAAQGIDEVSYRAIAKAQNEAAIKTAPVAIGAVDPEAKSALARIRGSKATARSFGGMAVYMTIRDAAEAAGVNGMDFQAINASHYFTDEFGSVFTVQEIDKGLFRSNTYWRTIIAGYKAGRSEKITVENYEVYKEMVEKKFGKYIPGGLFSKPKFIPGTERKSLPWYDEYLNERGWIDETGPHENPGYRPGIGTVPLA
jgi:hypothetical protein